PGAARTSIFRSGVLETKEGLTLRLVADLGSVNIMPIQAGSSPVVRYTVHVETDARGAAAAQLLKNYSLKAGTSSTGVEIAGQLFPQGAHYTNAQFWVQFEIAVPRNYNLEVNTDAGDIATGDLGGAAVLRTQGGNIIRGRIGRAGLALHRRPVAKLVTEGGHIKVIDFGEVKGSVRAQTGGGGIHVIYVSGPMEVESNGGSICLTGASGAVQAATSGGSITAWINPNAPPGSGPVRLEAPSQLASGTGDIIVYIPRNLAVNIDAVVANGTEQHIEADAGLHLTMQRPPNGVGQVRAVGVLNGGGAPLKLRTTAGKIRLQYLDAQVALRDSLIQEQQDRLNKRFVEVGFPPLSFIGRESRPSIPPPATRDKREQ